MMRVFMVENWWWWEYLWWKIDDDESICVLVMQVDILKKKNGNKYLTFDSVDENKEVLKKYPDVWDGIKNKIKAINSGEKDDYGKDYMKI